MYENSNFTKAGSHVPESQFLQNRKTMEAHILLYFGGQGCNVNKQFSYFLNVCRKNRPCALLSIRCIENLLSYLNGFLTDRKFFERLELIWRYVKFSIEECGNNEDERDLGPFSCLNDCRFSLPFIGLIQFISSFHFFDTSHYFPLHPTSTPYSSELDDSRKQSTEFKKVEMIVYLLGFSQGLIPAALIGLSNSLDEYVSYFDAGLEYLFLLGYESWKYLHDDHHKNQHSRKKEEYGMMIVKKTSEKEIQLIVNQKSEESGMN